MDHGRLCSNQPPGRDHCEKTWKIENCSRGLAFCNAVGCVHCPKALKPFMHPCGVTRCLSSLPHASLSSLTTTIMHTHACDASPLHRKQHLLTPSETEASMAGGSNFHEHTYEGPKRGRQQSAESRTDGTLCSVAQRELLTEENCFIPQLA